ncbi:MAG TPA: NnrU family protein [Mariprofundaceae bacterium]|nr:NnrU family protein [Mariprofundaceae bacterium]
MRLLACGLLLFFAAHLLPARPTWRQALQERLGPNLYRGLFSLLSLAGFVLIVAGFVQAPKLPLWRPPFWGNVATVLLMLLSLYSLMATYLPSKLRSMTAHPMLWGVVFWAAGHLLANGDLAAVLLFSTFLIYALFDMASANRRGARPQGGLVTLKQEARVLLATAVAYGVLVAAHPWFAGVRVLNLP